MKRRLESLERKTLSRFEYPEQTSQDLLEEVPGFSVESHRLSNQLSAEIGQLATGSCSLSSTPAVYLTVDTGFCSKHTLCQIYHFPPTCCSDGLDTYNFGPLYTPHLWRTERIESFQHKLCFHGQKSNCRVLKVFFVFNSLCKVLLVLY